ncbi:exonuclease 1 [Citrus sinensis]|uniref:Exonuclease 1 n=1 Tax=Citrus sinensis TaxID=2711 RepID=A0ACB8NID0_CITSI|nr:exonuclease 1 [Citrus sinensis]
MGIQGLLPLLKSIMIPIHIKELEGCCVAVDTYSWLHKGALSCSRELCKGLPTSRHIDYCMHRVNLLRHYGVKPILIFDGGLLPMKIEQENKRARSRKENLARAIECESEGNSSASYEFYQKAVDISPSIAHELIQVLKQQNVSYIVAPYEADAQMTFLAVSKQVEAVITEDSDLIPFGCSRIIFKMDKFGQGVEFQCSMLQKNKDLSFGGFTKQMLLEMCILSGCDYLQSLPGMGLKRAHALISKFKSYDKVIKHLKYSTVSVPPFYEESFGKAVLTFQHQRVYDPKTEDIEVSDNSHLVVGQNSHLKNFKPESERKKLDLPVQKNLLTKYFCFASLEAKRKFTTPRISPNHFSPEETSSLSPGEHHTAEASCDISCQSSSRMELETVGNFPHNSSEKNCFASEVPEFSASPSRALRKEHENKNCTDSVVGKGRTENRKVIVRSSYFLHKQVNKDDQENKQEKLVVENDAAIDMSENTGLQSAHFDYSYLKGTAIKRKTSLIDSVHTDKMGSKLMRTNASLHNNGYSDPNLDKTIATETDEAKFGANISHLGCYSEIAEKSMERFVSVISKYRCTSGSRASGLRAPLKDVRNTCTVSIISSVHFSPRTLPGIATLRLNLGKLEWRHYFGLVSFLSSQLMRFLNFTSTVTFATLNCLRATGCCIHHGISC